MLNNKIVEHIQKLHKRDTTRKDHKDILADLFLEDTIMCYVEEIQWDTHPRGKFTLKIEVFP